MATSASPPGAALSAARASATSGAVRSTQPTTPVTSPGAAATARNSSVSATLGTVWTTTVCPMPCGPAAASRSAGVNGRWISQLWSIHG